MKKEFLLALVAVLGIGFLAFDGWQNLQIKKLALAALEFRNEDSKATLLKETQATPPLAQRLEPDVSSEISKLQSQYQEKQSDIENLKKRIDILEEQLAFLQENKTVIEKPVVQKPVVIQKPAVKEKVQAVATKETTTPKSSSSPKESPTAVTGGISLMPPPFNVSSSPSAPQEKQYSKVIISEVQIAGQDDEKEEFVELYNSNDESVDLTGWYIHKKTKEGASESTFASNTLFKGKSIIAKGYFLVAREQYFSDIADMFVNHPLTKDNTLFLKNPNGRVVDMVGWGESQDFEESPTQNPSRGQSIGRNPEESDTNNNNLDFELDQPTPKSINVPFAFLPDPVIIPPELPPADITSPTNHQVVKILINEIQTEGQTAKDEFIELYNPNDHNVDLAGFALKKKNKTGNESNLVSSSAFSGIIPPLGFFLIAPQLIDETTPTYMGLISPDLLYSGKTFSVAQDNTVLLYDNMEHLLDKVGFGSAQDFEGSTAQNPETLQSIERKILGQDTDNNAEDFILLTEPTPKGVSP